MMRFWCDESIAAREKDKIEYILDYAFSIADEVEFNIVSNNEKKLLGTIDALKSDMTFRGQRLDKIYNGVECIRFRLTDPVKNFVKAKGIFGWLNSPLEDISFLKNGFEFLGTVTHENYLILQMTEEQREILGMKGFDFRYDYGTDAREEKD